MSDPTDASILVINAGSSSVKYAVFDAGLSVCQSGQAGITDHSDPAAYSVALDRIARDLADTGHGLETVQAVAHRVVHGGSQLRESCRIDDQTIALIEQASSLAPLHNPVNLLAIRTMQEHAPDLPQFASFDTAFHATNPEVATAFALPAKWRDMGLRRFGFHGLSYQALVSGWEEQTGIPLPRRLLAFHLGSGASICAIRDGVSVATTMGYSPLDGLTMSTRSGALDPAAILRMVELSNGSSPANAAREVSETLSRDSGLKGLSGATGDMKELLESSSESARFAVEHFTYWAARHAGSMIAAMGGVDAMAFTGGIGENAGRIREAIARKLEWTGNAAARPLVIAAREERQIAANTLGILERVSK